MYSVGRIKQYYPVRSNKSCHIKQRKLGWVHVGLYVYCILMTEPAVGCTSLVTFAFLFSEHVNKFTSLQWEFCCPVGLVGFVEMYCLLLLSHGLCSPILRPQLFFIVWH